MAHHGSRDSRLTGLRKKRCQVAEHRDHVASATRSRVWRPQGDVGVDDRGAEIVPVLEKRQEPSKSEDLPKVLATVVNMIDDHSSSTSVSGGFTIPSHRPLIHASLNAFPAFALITADTPSVTSSQTSTSTSIASVTSSRSSAVTSRPLINSSLPTPSSASGSGSGPSSPNASASGLSASSLLSASSASRVSRTSTQSSPTITSSTSSSFSSSASSSLSSSTSSSFSSAHISSTTSSSSTTTDWTTYTGIVGGFGRGGSGTSSGGPTSTGTDATPGPSGPTVPPTTSKIVGGVVGSVAGAVMFVVLAMFLLHRRRNMRKSPEGLPSSEAAVAGSAAGGASQPAPMISRWSRDSIFTASYFVPAFMKRRRQSNQTSQTDSTLVSSGGGSERGFQKVSGRKIPSVLLHGGDGFGGGYGTGSPTVSEPSMTPVIPSSPVNPRSSQPPPSTPFGMPLDASYTREAEEEDPAMVVRASPARTPVASSTSVASVSAPINVPRAPPPALSPTIPQRPDTLGRSHPSFDGSRGSRFTESL